MTDKKKLITQSKTEIYERKDKYKELRELFGALKFKKPTKQLLREVRRDSILRYLFIYDFH